MKRTKKLKDLPLIGRKERIDLPDIGLSHLDAKVDTGAYTSSLHCRLLNQKTENGIDYIEFIPLAHKYKTRHAKPTWIPITRKKMVKSSSGHAEERFIVTLRVAIAGQLITTEFSLSDRSSMKHTILLGRKFLKGRFWVDVARKYTLRDWEIPKL
ncbi:MAG: ATP-dependent zinc protease [Candidatus Competibacteraceae bacterium]|nr:ATP-dependent zinc protease [Candidatus Competibacteraceae bacterium]